MKKWTKAAAVAVPLVFATSVYALANESSAYQATIQIKEVQPSQSVTEAALTPADSLQIPNPFVVNRERIQQQVAAQTSSTTQTSSAASSASADTLAEAGLTIDQIRKVKIQAKTDRGGLKLEYRLEGNEMPRLDGEIGDVKVRLSGEKAKELMNQLLDRWELYGILQQILANPAAKVQSKAILALEEFEIETLDGKQIEMDENRLKSELEKQKENLQDRGKQLGKGKIENKDKKEKEKEDKKEDHQKDGKEDQGEDD